MSVSSKLQSESSRLRERARELAVSGGSRLWSPLLGLDVPVERGDSGGTMGPEAFVAVECELDRTRTPFWRDRRMG